MPNPAVLPAVSPAVPSRQKRLNDFFVADKGVKHQRADGVDVPSTPAKRHLLQVLATDTSDGDDAGEDDDDEPAVVGVGDAAGRELAACCRASLARDKAGAG